MRFFFVKMGYKTGRDRFVLISQQPMNVVSGI